MIRGLTDRAVKLSNLEHRPENLRNINEVSCENKYPGQFYESVIKKRMHDIYTIS